MRVSKLGIAETIGRRQYTAKPVASALKRLIGNSGVHVRASRIGGIVSEEDGAQTAADAIDRVFGSAATC